MVPAGEMPPPPPPPPNPDQGPRLPRGDRGTLDPRDRLRKFLLFLFQDARAHSKHYVPYSNIKFPGCTDTVEFVDVAQGF